MKIFKFGGASVKDANAVKNVANILNKFINEQLIVVVSAMGKTTNALEKLTNAYFHKTENSEQILEEIKSYHFNITEQLLHNKQHPFFDELENLFIELKWAIEDEPTAKYNDFYKNYFSLLKRNRCKK